MQNGFVATHPDTQEEHFIDRAHFVPSPRPAPVCKETGRQMKPRHQTCTQIDMVDRRCVRFLFMFLKGA